MKHFLIIALLLGLLLVVACGEEAVEETDGDATEEIEETTAPVEAEVTDYSMAIEVADKLLTAIAEGDRETVMELCFQDISVIADEVGMTEEEQAEAREKQVGELELFELGWDELTSGQATLLEWNNLEVVDTAPATDIPNLFVYMIGVERLVTEDGVEPETVEHSVVVLNHGDRWFAKWPF